MVTELVLVGTHTDRLPGIPEKETALCPITRRAELGQWFTPEWAAVELVERYFGDLNGSDYVIEPSCGFGAFLKAIPNHVPAIGVEIDPALAVVAENNTGRHIIVGDFRNVQLPCVPTAIVGNPPYDVRLIEGFLRRAAIVLPDNGRCGFLLPAYAMQTHRRIWRWHQTWSMVAEIVPRRLFPRLSLPLVFVQFKKEKVRTLVGFALYREAVEFENLGKAAKLILTYGHPRKGIWRALVEATLERLGGKATLQDIYTAIEPRRPTANAWWREKVRQVLQLHFARISPGLWALREA